MPRTVTKTATARQAKSGRLGHSTDAGKIVLEFIKMNPGKRGVEIAQALEARTPSIPERTVRTALHRLRHQAEKIKNVDGKWYAADYDTLRRI